MEARPSTGDGAEVDLGYVVLGAARLSTLGAIDMFSGTNSQQKEHVNWKTETHRSTPEALHVSNICRLLRKGFPCHN